MDAATQAELDAMAAGDRRNVQTFIASVPPARRHRLGDWIGQEVDDWIERPEVWRAVRGVAQARVTRTTRLTPSSPPG